MLATIAAVTGCVTTPQTREPVAMATKTTTEVVGGYVGDPVDMECVPFARSLSRVELMGNASLWWDRAEGRYERSAEPVVGAVMAFRGTRSLPAGHLAVVSDIVSDREILVTHANWVRDRVIQDVQVVDVSASGDWSAVRVWWPPADQLGQSRYPVAGFILPDQPLSREQLLASVPAAIVEGSMN